MALKIEQYGLIGDCRTAALVGCDGSIDWLCLPSFDSDACFAALLGTTEHGRWSLAPEIEVRRSRRFYRTDTLILETRFETDSGAVAVVDFMAVQTETPVVVRMVVGLRGQVPMHMQLVLRFGYGQVVPWVQRHGRGIRAVGGPNGVLLQADAQLRGEDLTTVSQFTVVEGQTVSFSLVWYPSHLAPPGEVDPPNLLRQSERWWRGWVASSAYSGRWRDAVVGSLVTLKALTYAPTGGIVAAPTTSLPEKIGSTRNWDYRYCWLRDATFTLFALLSAGYESEAADWRQWLLRAVAGRPSDLQIVYGLRGERRLAELALDWLPGYEKSLPVRIGNAASRQLQLDVYGEVLDVMYQCRCKGLEPQPADWRLEHALVEFLESVWSNADDGIWEIRGSRRRFTHSAVMAWVGVDRAIKSMERFGLEGPLERWKSLRATIHEEVCQKGFSTRLDSFVQYFGGQELDASLLMIPLVGFLPSDDPRVRGTLEAVKGGLMADGFLCRYAASNHIDGLPPGEGAFLPCTFWLADNYALAGQHAEAERTFEMLLELRNDVGLLSEEYDPRAKRFLGNFPQALSHIALINTATNLAHAEGTTKQRIK